MIQTSPLKYFSLKPVLNKVQTLFELLLFVEIIQNRFNLFKVNNIKENVVYIKREIEEQNDFSRKVYL